MIYSSTPGNLAKHHHHIKLRQHHLQLKLEKYEFHRENIQFLGYIIDHQGIHMDQMKVQADKDWQQPSTIKYLQRFLGFANFYHHFIANFSQICALLTSLLRKKPKSPSWTPDTIKAFQQLKDPFCTSPTLLHPNPELPFVAEVGASTIVVGGLLSQCHGEPPTLHPCAFFSKNLSPLEQNYDIGNRELLVIKLALQEL